MEEQATATPKKTTRTRKTATSSESVSTEASSSSTVNQVFDDLMTKLIQSKQEFDNLQKEIVQIKQDWAREQKQHEVDLVQQKTQEELDRKREEETYQYATALARKRSFGT